MEIGVRGKKKIGVGTRRAEGWRRVKMGVGRGRDRG